MNRVRFVSLAVILALSACDTSTPTDVSYPVDFERGIELSCMVSEGHFVNGTYEGATNPSCLLIWDYECFDSYFSIGWVQGMDESKLITDERMEDRFVLSIIYQGDDVISLGIEKVVLLDGKLIVCYTQEVTMSDVSFMGNYHLTLLIDDCDFESVMLFENGRRVTDIRVKPVYCR